MRGLNNFFPLVLVVIPYAFLWYVRQMRVKGINRMLVKITDAERYGCCVD